MEMGISGPIVNVVKSMYESLEYTVNANDYMADL